MAGDPVIIFDTNVLRNTSWQSAPFRQLIEISASRKIQVYIPEIVLNERRTQWREDLIKAAAGVKKSLERYANDPLLTDDQRAAYAATSAALPEHDYEQLCIDSFERYFRDARFEVFGLTVGQAEVAFSRYFAGAKPFKDVKARNDIPDGFVFAAAAEIIAKVKSAYFLCKDNELASAVAEIDGAAVLTSVEDALKMPEIGDLSMELETNKAWLRVKDHYPVERAREELVTWATERLHMFLEGKTVWSEKIPSDGNDGEIEFAEEPDKVEISEFTDWGGGDLSATITLTCDVQLHLMVHKGDAYSVPDWVSVSIRDFDDYNYFDASASARVAVKMDVSFRAVVADEYDDDEETVLSVTPDQDPRISFLSGN
ncbi:PIN domain-containing protein [Sphingomonas sp. BAUL-RG-20F-R05-02]|uniref:PIN domain-containing protein n=1 Tax=Sphingomonas sp. BAUL-RG-20F-R05-02 TaxID=2914830 RepID=UPI001F56945A|nr:PIN domain-containing protein [Sphingomonas sp. BAUL-RG-20F-R05-02]